MRRVVVLLLSLIAAILWLAFAQAIVSVDDSHVAAHRAMRSD